jgi:DNA (cytosine-5)-methyltransferase 1
LKAKKTIVAAVDLFCGAGGLTYGLGNQGIDVRAGFDLDPACAVPYEQNNKARFVLADVQSVHGRDLNPWLANAQYTMLAGCAPCQPFSRYSKTGRGKTNSRRWQLVLEFGRLVREVSPDFVTMENVPLLAQHPAFEEFKKSLEGYQLWTGVVNTSLYGGAQTRQRLVLIASKHGKIVFPAARTGSQKTVRDVIGHLPAVRAGVANVADPLHIAAGLTPMNLKRIRASKPGGTWKDWPVSLRATCHQKPSGNTYPAVYGRMQWDQLAPTMTTQCYGYGNGRFGHPEQDRAITLREAALFQGFPETYDFTRGGESAQFLPLGRLIGNAVPVQLAETIATCIRNHIRQIK